MFAADLTPFPVARVVVVGAGMGGLAAALRLRATGYDVTLLDSHAWPGGKMRTVPSEAGPVDAGPTVLTMRHVLEELFAAAGAELDDHVRLIREPLLARHFWPDGSTLDLTDDTATNAEAIAAFGGPKARDEFLRFSEDTRTLFDRFDAPMMQAAAPQLAALAQAALGAPRQLALLSPFATMAKHLRRRFSDPRLAQLFGRYATYVGGTPGRAPALLTLIWQAEAAGVWRIEGGMHRLAEALAQRFVDIGGTLRLGAAAQRIDVAGGRVAGVTLADGKQLPADIVVHAGDPRALAMGALGNGPARVARETRIAPRSLSARVWSFAARVTPEMPLAHHNVFFAADPSAEFEDLAGGAIPSDPTLYVCAEDRGSDKAAPISTERFEIILNAAPLTLGRAGPDEVTTCRQATFPTLARFGLRFDRDPPDAALSTPETFENLFPASAGSLYGQSPEGMTASLKRPRARTAIRGLYLAGGGTHPGAGVPMAALSGKHAAEAIAADLVST